MDWLKKFKNQKESKEVKFDIKDTSSEAYIKTIESLSYVTPDYKTSPIFRELVLNAVTRKPSYKTFEKMSDKDLMKFMQENVWH